MKIALSAGHNVYVNNIFDRGTSGYGKTEANMVKETVKILKKLLEDKGHKVVDVTPYNKKFYDGSYYRINKTGHVTTSKSFPKQYTNAQKNAHKERALRVKNSKADLYLDIHLNSGGGTGPETIVYSSKSKAYNWARKITNSIASKTGLTNQRGVKVRPGYWSVHLQPQASIIVEGAFMDNKRDMESITPQKYAEGIADVFPNIKPNPKPIIKDHWAKKYYETLKNYGINIEQERFNDNITRGEVFKLLTEITKPSTFLYLLNKSYNHTIDIKK